MIPPGTVLDNVKIVIESSIMNGSVISQSSNINAYIQLFCEILDYLKSSM